MQARDDDLTIIASPKEWCVAETGGVMLLLLLTSMRTAWLDDFTRAVLEAAARCPGGRAPLLTVFRLDKRYPVDIGFKGNLAELSEARAKILPVMTASSIVIEFGGFLAATLRGAFAALDALRRANHPETAHRTVVSGASWIRPYVAEECRRDVKHYVDAVNRMKSLLGCTDDSRRRIL